MTLPHAIAAFTALGVLAWGWALLKADLPGYLDLMNAQILRIAAGAACFLAAGSLALVAVLR